MTKKVCIAGATGWAGSALAQAQHSQAYGIYRHVLCHSVHDWSVDVTTISNAEYDEMIRQLSTSLGGDKNAMASAALWEKSDAGTACAQSQQDT